LKGKGVRQRNAVHMLRKESGSLVASSYGIEAARQHLGHRDIRTTSAHYVSKKRRVEVSLTPPADMKLQAFN
jgi:integrase